MREKQGTPERRGIEIYDFYRGKKIKVLTEDGKVEKNWEIFGGNVNEVYLLKKQNHSIQTKTVPVEKFLEWQQ